MSEVKEWLAAMGIAGIERLSEVFEAQGFSSRKSLQYLHEADLDYMFLSPKKLRLAEKRGITQEQQQLKRTLFNGDKEINQTASPANGPTETPPTAVDSPLERRKMELVENVSSLKRKYQAHKSICHNWEEKMIRLKPWRVVEFVDIVIRAATTKISVEAYNAIPTRNAE